MSKPKNLEIEEKLKKLQIKTLYENSEDYRGEITLSETSKNFDYVNLTLVTSDNEKTIRIDKPDGKIFWEELGYSLSNEYAKVFSKFAINGTKITPVVANCGYYTINYTNNQVLMHLDRTNYIRIKKVIGGKYYEEK